MKQGCGGHETEQSRRASVPAMGWFALSKQVMRYAAQAEYHAGPCLQGDGYEAYVERSKDEFGLGGGRWRVGIERESGSWRSAELYR